MKRKQKKQTIKRKPVRRFIRKRIKNVRSGVKNTVKVGKKGGQQLQKMQLLDVQNPEEIHGDNQSSVYAVNAVERTIKNRAYGGIRYTEKAGHKSVVKVFRHFRKDSEPKNGNARTAKSDGKVKNQHIKQEQKRTYKSGSNLKRSFSKESGKGIKRKANKVVYQSTGNLPKSRKVMRVTRKVIAVPLRGGMLVGKFSLKAIVTVIKAVHATIIGMLAFGWVIAIGGIVIALFAWLMQSPFAIFFSLGGDKQDPDVISVQTVMEEVDQEYQRRIETIKIENPADETQMVGTRSSWKEVLSVYAVKMNMDPEDPQDVLTLNETKALQLKEVFWNMNSIRYELSEEEKKTEGKDTETEGNVEVMTVLHIFMNRKSYQEMMDAYAFDSDQKDMVVQLMEVSNDGLWEEVDMGTVYIDEDLRWPLDGYTTVSSEFGYRTNPLTGELELHRGIDIPAPEGTPVHAAADGTVIIAGWNDSYGNYVKIDHGDGLITLYAHNSELNVEVGQKVEQGDVIAYVGSTGDSTGNHCHWEVEKDGEIMQLTMK